jgi:hypothetical protein
VAGTIYGQAIEWLKLPPLTAEPKLEVRQVFETDDFGAEMTPELRAQEERLRKRPPQKITVSTLSFRSPEAGGCGTTD